MDGSQTARRTGTNWKATTARNRHWLMDFGKVCFTEPLIKIGIRINSNSRPSYRTPFARYSDDHVWGLSQARRKILYWSSLSALIKSFMVCVPIPCSGGEWVFARVVISRAKVTSIQKLHGDHDHDNSLSRPNVNKSLIFTIRHTVSMMIVVA